MRAKNSKNSNFNPFRYKDLNELKQEFQNLKIELPFDLETDILKTPLNLKELFVPNRLTIQPMEGFDANLNGSPGELTFRRYRKYAQGGAGLIWFEATSISDKAKSNSHQLAINKDNLDKFNRFVKEIKNEGNETLKSLGFSNDLICILQLNHSGRYTKINGKKFPLRAYEDHELDSTLNVAPKKGKIISDEELQNLEDIWVDRAILAEQAGFDGVDIKACHGYLISELLRARRRKDSNYGGKTLRNRSRFFLNIIKKLNKKIDKENFLITTRLSIYNGREYPNSFGVDKESKQIPPKEDLTEPLELIRELSKLDVHLINISMGNPHFKPFITRPYDIPAIKGTIPPEHPLKSVYRLVNLTSKIKKLIPQRMKIIGSGYSYLRQFSAYLTAGLIRNKKVDLCGFGRMAFANPSFPKQIFINEEINKKKVCITCSKCSALMREGKKTGCVIRDPLYNPKN
ncbi:MAG: Flavin oxidoreductase/NADH oxidase [Promethearchaeota archaeon]|nr:MAG: Flavin oxidoreductase/NADH oxidase [Candidatus Lokiarchaeota archaeon]